MVLPVYEKSSAMLIDLLFIYKYYYNGIPYSSQSTMECELNLSKLNEDIAFFEDAVQMFAPYDPVFIPFFLCGTGGKTFVENEFLHNGHFSGYSFTQMINELGNTESIRRKLTRHYLSDAEELYGDMYTADIGALTRGVLSAGHSDILKLQLLRFLNEPQKVLSLLADDMRQKYRKLERYYAAQSATLEHAAAVEWDSLAQRLIQLPEGKINLDSAKEIQYTFCLIRKNFVFSEQRRSRFFVALGADYREYLNTLLAKEAEFQLYDFCRALSDKYRIRVFYLLLEQGEMQTNRIAETVGISLTAMFYHLDMMTKAGVLKFRTSGRAVFYSVNKQNIARAGQYLLDYGSEK